MREDQAKIKREDWKAKGSPPCQHRTLKLLYTVENYITGDYVCFECGELVGKYEPFAFDTYRRGCKQPARATLA
jgi:hypothetical protein